MKTANIRRANEIDLDGIANLYRLFWGEKSNIQKMNAVLSEIQNNSNYALFVAEDDGKIVGTIFGVVCKELYGECQPFLVMDDLVVDPIYTRSGIARRLMNAIEKFGIKMGCSQIQFITESNRNETIKFYESIGFDAKMHIGFKRKLVPIQNEQVHALKKK